MRTKLLALAAALLACIPLMGAHAAETHAMPGPGAKLPTVSGFSLKSCTGNPGYAQRINLSIGGTKTYAMVVRPSAKPKGIVMYAHGYSEWAQESDLIKQYEAFAAQGALVIAPDLRGTIDPKNVKDLDGSSRGYPIANGTLDMAALAKAALAVCPTKTVISSGGSMGGAISAFAAALQEKRKDGSPLFTYWIGLSTLGSLVDEWAGATALGAASAYDAGSAVDMAAEAGGTPATAPSAYLARSVALLPNLFKGSGLKGAVLLHSAGDFDITADQFAGTVAGLRLSGIPTEAYVATVASPGEVDSSLDGNTLDTVAYYAGIYFPQLLAGHEAPYLRTQMTSEVAKLLNGGKVSNLQVDVQVNTY